jgi:hypothetical protein
VGIRKWLSHHLGPAAVESFPIAAAAPMEPKPLTPEHLADLEAARADLRSALEESGVTSFHACTREGSRWEEDLDSVRAMTAAIRSTQKDTARAENEPPQT